MMLALHSVAFDQLLPIFMHYPPQSHSPKNPDISLPFKFSGGFGLESGRIGTLFTVYGICGMFIQFLVFPPVARKLGILNCLKICSFIFPVVYILTPFTALVDEGVWQQAAIFALMFVKCVAVIFAFPCSTILLTNSASSLRILGTLNGFATSTSALGRAAGPAMMGGLFTVGMREGYIILPWWFLAFLSSLGCIPIFYLIEGEGFGSSASNTPDDSDDEFDDDYDDDDVFVEGSHASSRSTPKIVRPSSEGRTFSQAILSGDEYEDAVEDDNVPITATTTSNKTLGLPRSRSGGAHGRRLSSPLGQRIVSSGGRRLSSSLGQTNNGLGTGGATLSG
jgi:hypothetical protein